MRGDVGIRLYACPDIVHPLQQWLIHATKQRAEIFVVALETLVVDMHDDAPRADKACRLVEAGSCAGSGLFDEHLVAPIGATIGRGAVSVMMWRFRPLIHLPAS